MARARVYRGQSKEQRRDERRERLLAAGLEHFGTEGYASSTIEGLCKAAGVTARHFYEQFEGREALLRAVYDGVVSEAALAVSRALADANDASAEERTTAAVSAFVRSYLEDPRRARIASIEVIGVSAGLEAHRRSILRAFAGIIESEGRALAEAGRLSPERDYELAGVAMAGALNELMCDWLTRPKRPTVGRFVALVAEFFLTVLEGGERHADRPPLRAPRAPAPRPRRSQR